MADPKSLMSQDAAAAALAISPSTIQRMIRRGEIRVLRIGRCVRIPVSEIERLTTMEDPSCRK
jgi:excisionase family DNA binding protein